MIIRELQNSSKILNFVQADLTVMSHSDDTPLRSRGRRRLRTTLDAAHGVRSTPCRSDANVPARRMRGNCQPLILLRRGI